MPNGETGLCGNCRRLKIGYQQHPWGSTTATEELWDCLILEGGVEDIADLDDELKARLARQEAGNEEWDEDWGVTKECPFWGLREETNDYPSDMT